MKPKSQNSVSAFTEIGSAYVDIAFDSPYLFKYLYLNENGNYCVVTLETLLSAINNQELLKQMVSFFSLSEENALEYLTNTIIYSHGILALVISGVLKMDRRSVKKKINDAGIAFLAQAGGNIEKALKAENYLQEEEI